jgi:hypothetical protein
MKKEVPNTIKIETPYDAKNIESKLSARFIRILKKGYRLSIKDSYIYWAIVLRNLGLDQMPDTFKERYQEDEEFRYAIEFEATAISIEQSEYISEDKLRLHTKLLLKRAISRKNIVKKEVTRTGANFNKVNHDHSNDYKILLESIKEFDDLTLIDWFVPIELTFERFVHIYVKHVTETKFGEAKFKKRTFFDYKHTELLVLIKTILKQEERDIKEHFLNNLIAEDKNQMEKVKDYHRGFGKFRSIEFGGDRFKLSIDKYGKINTFHQL